MPDRRKHRGPHPADRKLFSPDVIPLLQEAVGDFSWLLTRGYAETSALKLVGDRYRLTERQRKAVLRSSCSDQALADRQEKRLSAEELKGRRFEIDGFNLITTLEAALAGGVILSGRDGCYRDLASMHGNYRKVAETQPILEWAGRTLEELGVAACLWYLDSPVSNSGRLKQMISATAEQHGWKWNVELVPNPDDLLILTDEIVVSADSAVLDRCRRWFHLAGEVVERHIPQASILPLGDRGGE